MEPWSDLPVRERFRIKFYLDTNILSYLVDNTYSGLTFAAEYLKNSEFADLVSSKYVIFEFVGIRKREHYLQKVLQNSTNTVGRVNISSLLKYKDNFNAPEIKFEDVQVDIKLAVEAEVHAITHNFGIDYSTNMLHDNLLNPTFELNLSSRISKEDSLVLISAVWSDVATKEEYVLIASNDQQFIKSYDTGSLSQIFANHGLKPPIVEYLCNIKVQGGNKVNLTDNNDDVHLPDFLLSKLKELIIEKNKSLFLGKTVPCGNGAGFPTDLVCFSLNPDTPLNNNVYLTIIGRNLDFVYSIKLPIASFWDQTAITVYPFQDPTAINISFRPMDNSSGVVSALPAPIISKLRETDNLVFINPDS